jgi:hypothetical protein
MDKLLDILYHSGSLRYFYLDGGVAVHDSSGVPVKNVNCSIDQFCKLRVENKIQFIRNIDTGYPYYADRVKFSLYKAVSQTSV